MCDQLSFIHWKLIRIKVEILRMPLKEDNNGWNGVLENATVCIQKDVRNISEGCNNGNWSGVLNMIACIWEIGEMAWSI